MTKPRTKSQDSYIEMLRNPKWQRKRLEILQRFNFRCDECAECNKELQVHHCWYEKGKMPWDYPDECFLVLCDECHLEWHQQKLDLDKAVARQGIGNMNLITALIKKGLQGDFENINDILYNQPPNINLIMVASELMDSIKEAMDQSHLLGKEGRKVSEYSKWTKSF